MFACVVLESSSDSNVSESDSEEDGDDSRPSKKFMNGKSPSPIATEPDLDPLSLTENALPNGPSLAVFTIGVPGEDADVESPKPAAPFPV